MVAPREQFIKASQAMREEQRERELRQDEIAQQIFNAIVPRYAIMLNYDYATETGSLLSTAQERPNAWYRFWHRALLGISWIELRPGDNKE